MSPGAVVCLGKGCSGVRVAGETTVGRIVRPGALPVGSSVEPQGDACSHSKPGASAFFRNPAIPPERSAAPRHRVGQRPRNESGGRPANSARQRPRLEWSGCRDTGRKPPASAGLARRRAGAPSAHPKHNSGCFGSFRGPSSVEARISLGSRKHSPAARSGLARAGRRGAHSRVNNAGPPRSARGTRATRLSRTVHSGAVPARCVVFFVTSRVSSRSLWC